MSNGPAHPDVARDDDPILGDAFPIPFSRIRADGVVPSLRRALAEAEAVLETVAAAEPPFRWASVIEPLEAMTLRLERATTIVSHLDAVRQDSELRAAWSEVLPELAAFEARSAAHPGVYHVLRAYARTEEAAALPAERARRLELLLDEMRRAGAGLNDASRTRVEAIGAELAALENRFQNHLVDGVNAYALDVVDAERVRGIPDAALRRARAAAEEAGVDGWRFTLHPPSYLAVMDHAEDRELRRELHAANDAKGTGEGRDNRELIPEILRLRREMANLLGYADWADLRTEPRMVRSGRQAQAFERDLAARVEPHLREEVAELEAFAREELGIDRLEPWDVRFAFERLRRARYGVDAEALRAWFPLDRLQEGLFELAETLFGVAITPAEAPEVWHPDVGYHEVRDATGTLLGAFYTDWHPRRDKRGGAWMTPLVTGGPTPDGGFEPHLGAISGNLTPPDGDGPALLAHDEATTIFHEFGHLLHHLLSRVEVRSLAGTAVAWDFVELPSQLMENWLWEESSLARIARHVETGEPLPEGTLDRMRAARAFGAAHRMMRQLSFGTVDLALHVDFDPSGGEDPVDFGRDVMAPFQIRPDAAPKGFLPAFAHVFAGGYAAGYYAYMWSEMLEADVFGRFLEAGLHDRAMGEAFARAVLSRGNGAPPERLIREFLGRDPDPDAMLRRNLGLEAAD